MLWKCSNCGRIEEGIECGHGEWQHPPGWRIVCDDMFTIIGELCDKCEDLALDFLTQHQEEVPQ